MTLLLVFVHIMYMCVCECLMEERKKRKTHKLVKKFKASLTFSEFPSSLTCNVSMIILNASFMNLGF